MAIGVYSFETAESIRRKTLSADDYSQGYAPAPDYEPVWFFVKLTEDLEACPDPLKEWKTAKARTCPYKSTEDTLERELKDTEDAEIEVVNRSPHYFGRKGEFIWVRLVDAEYTPCSLFSSEYQGVLAEDLDGALNALSNPATAEAHFIQRNINTGNMEVSCQTITITSRFPNISLVSGTYIRFRMQDAEWMLTAADCSDSSIPLSPCVQP